LWQELGGFGWGSNGILCRLTVPIETIETLVPQLTSESAPGRRAQYVCHYGTGVVWALMEPTTAGLELYGELAAVVRQYRGHSIIVSAPAALKQNLDVWGEPPTTLALMRRIKQQFDPDGILSPGRFVNRL
jgi:glycolate oxidase FAD binding subunit